MINLSNASLSIRKAAALRGIKSGKYEPIFNSGSVIAKVYNQRSCPEGIEIMTGEAENALDYTWQEIKKISSTSKQRHDFILNTAKEILAKNGGHTAIDSLDQEDRVPKLRKMAKEIVKLTDCHIDSAKRNLAKALRLDRGGAVKQWGGARKGSGRPRKEKNEVDWKPFGICQKRNKS